MKRLAAAAFVALLLLPQAAQAQGASKESVLRYMELTDADRGIEQISNVVFQRLANQLRTQNPAITDDMLRAVGESIKTVLYANTDGYRDLIASALRSVLTEEEVQAANAFYASEQGRSFSSKLPQLQQAGAATGREWLAGMQSDLQQAVRQALGQ